MKRSIVLGRAGRVASGDVEFTRCVGARALWCALALSAWGCDDSSSSSSPADAGDAAPTANPSESTAEAPMETTAPTDEPTGSDPLFGGNTDVEVTSAPEAGAPPEDLPALLQCEAFGGMDAARLVDDLEDGDQRLVSDDGQWFEVKDPSTGTFTLAVEQIPEGRGDSHYAMHATGSANTEWGATFGVAWDGCLFDASIYRGVTFWARGNGGPVRYLSAIPGVVPLADGGSCEVLASCWDAHTTSLVFDDTWRQYFVPFDVLEQTGWGADAGPYNPAQIFTLQFQTDQNEDFDYWVDDLSFYTDEDRALAEADAGPVATPNDGGTDLVDAGTTDASVPDASVGTDLDGATEPDASTGPDASTTTGPDASTALDASTAP